jgi:hypothetical protein
MERAVICLAGPICEERFTGIPVDEQHGSYTDMRMCKEALARLQVGPPLTVESLIPFTRLMIEHSWPCIQPLASQLLISRELSYDTCLRLIQQA